MIDETLHDEAEVDDDLARYRPGRVSDEEETEPPRARRLAGMARARRSDPETSQAAARSVGGLNAKQRAVLALLRERGPMTDEALVVDYALAAMTAAATDPAQAPEQSASGIRTRRRELADAGLVVDTGERRKSRSGRAAIVWGVA